MTPTTPPRGRTSSTSSLPHHESPRNLTPRGSPRRLLQPSAAMLSKRKGGGKKGTKRNDRPQSFWYTLCEIYENGLKENRWKTQAEFLRSSAAKDTNPNDKMGFSRALKKFRKGELKNVKETRVRARKFEDVAEYLLEYITLQEKLYQQDKCGVAWVILQEKAIKFAKSKGYPTDDNDPDAFKASPGWISNVLKREGSVSIKLHGEAVDLTDAEAAELLNPVRAHLADLMETHDLDPSSNYSTYTVDTE